MRSGAPDLKAVLMRITLAFAALLMPHAAYADCPPPATPPSGDGFVYCFDGPHIGPQPIVDAHKGNHLVAEVELNGHKLLAIFDTGAEISIVDSSIAKDIGLKAGGSYGMTGLDGKNSPAQKAPIDRLVIGGFIRNGGAVAIADLSAMRQQATQPFAMILGADVLSQVALFVDRDDRNLVVVPGNAKAAGSPWTAPLSIRQPGNVFMTRLSVNGHSLDVKLDTGADDELALRDASWAKIVPSTARATTIAAAGVAGISVGPMARLTDVRIGDKPIGDAIATQVSSAAAAAQSDGILGMGILSRYSFFLNPQTGVMVLVQPKKPVPPRRETMAGLQGLPTDEGLVVMHVMAHSPAEAAGIKAGERICTIDGETVRAAWAGTPKGGWMIGPEGKTVTLGRCAGGSVRLTLQRFY